MFKAKFGNIGPIKEAELELGDMTVIAGENNTGKTYLAYTLYGFLYFLRRNFEFDLWPSHLGASIEFTKIDGILEQLKRHRKSTIDGKEMTQYLLEESSRIFSESRIGHVFSSSDKNFEKSNFQIANVEDQEDESSFSFRFVNPGSEVINILRSDIKNGNWIFTLDKTQDEKTGATNVRIALSTLLVSMLCAKLPKVFILPAERLSISLFYKGLDFSRGRLVGELQRLSGDDKVNQNSIHNLNRLIRRRSVRYAQPIRDNIDFTRELPDTQDQEQPNLFRMYSDQVESIWGGYYRVVKDEIRFSSTKSSPNAFDIPLHLASSSARGISDLYFYLNYFAKPGELLMIDEPESHLSPANQIQMARLLVSHVNKGLKILLTTHSDYIIKEINNLIMLSSNFKGKEEFMKKNKDYTESHYLKPNSVKAYICERGTLTPQNVNNMGMEMPIFDDAIRGIDQVAEHLYWKLKGIVDND